jgi:hypothetical protein
VPSGFVDDLDSHRYVLAAVFAETQGAIASGDLDALTERFASSAEAQADALMATLPGNGESPGGQHEARSHQSL